MTAAIGTKDLARLSAPRLSRAAKRARGRLQALLGSLSAAVRKPARLIRAVLRMIAKDRGFGFWWLAVTAAIALAVGLLVGLLLTPVIGIVAALIVGIWMLARRAASRTA